VIPHDHEDITQVVIACPACIERVRAQEAADEQPELDFPVPDDQPSLFEV
jgi:hypothetical protein